MRTPENSVSIIAVFENLAKMITIDSSEFLKLTSSLQQEKWLHFGKKSELCAVFACPLLLALRPDSSLENPVCKHRESQQPIATGEHRMAWCSCKASFLKNCHYLISLVVPQKTPLARLYLFALTWSRKRFPSCLFENH